MNKIIDIVKKYFKGLFKNRNFKYGANTVLMILLMLGIIWFVQKIVSNYDLKYDATANKQYSLSDQTRKILGGLKEDLRITAFVKRGMGYERFMGEMLADMAKISSKIKIKTYDLDMDTAAAKAYHITEYNVSVLEIGDKRKDVLEREVFNQAGRQIEFRGEQAIVNAILSVSEASKKIIYFTTGHMEKDIDDNNTGAGMFLAKNALLSDNYEVRKLNLISEGKVPEDCSVLIVAGPQKGFSGGETGAIKKYLEKGGKALLLFEPLVNAGFDSLLDNWELKLDNDFVVDTKSCLSLVMYADPASPIPNYEKHLITEPLSKNRVPVFFPSSRSISTTARKEKRGVTKEKLLTTSLDSWGETDLAALKTGKARYDAGVDLKEPLCLGYAVFETVKTEVNGKPDIFNQMRLVVLGDSDFITNAPGGVGNVPGCLDLFMNSVNWLLDEGQKISLRPKTVDIRPLILTPAQERIIVLMTIVITPLVVVGTGFFVWWRRRGK